MLLERFWRQAHDTNRLALFETLKWAQSKKLFKGYFQVVVAFLTTDHSTFLGSLSVSRVHGALLEECMTRVHMEFTVEFT